MKKFLNNKTAFFLVAFSIGLHLQINAATSVSQWGITWTFDKDYAVGQFVNGDWYVVDPGNGVTVTSVSPGPSNGINGSMINPGLNAHAYDNRVSLYKDELAVSYPLRLKADQSLISVDSLTESDWENGKYRTSWQGTVTDRYKIKTAAVLTCLAEAPPSNSFRPPFIGDHKPIFTYDQVNFGWLPNFPAPNSLTNSALQGIERGFERVWIMSGFAHNARETHPVENQKGYHRDIGVALSTAASILATDGWSRDLLVGYMQVGIDYYGMAIQPTGTGDSAFWKWPTIFAGLLLGEANMYHLFSDGEYRGNPRESEKLYYVKDGSSNQYSNIVPGNNQKPFTQTYQGFRVAFRKGGGNEEHEHLDPSEWDRVDSGGGKKADSYRRCCDSHPHIGQLLAAALISRNENRPALQPGTGGSSFANTPIKCFFPAGESFDGTDTEEFAPFDYMLRWWFEDGSTNSQIVDDLLSIYAEQLVDPEFFSQGKYRLDPNATLDGGGNAFIGNTSDATLKAYTPTSDIESGEYLQPVSLNLSTATLGATIHYTTDGSTPSNASATYDSPILISSTTAVKAKAYKDGLSPSDTKTVFISFPPFEGSDIWDSVNVQNIDSNFTLSLSVIAHDNNIDAVVGLGEVATELYSELPVTVRLYKSGFVDARDGSGYRSLNTLAYVAGDRVDFDLTIDTVNAVYDVSARVNDGPTTQIASRFSFRTGQENIKDMRYLTYVDSTNKGFTLESVQFGGQEGAPYAPSSLFVDQH